MHIEADVPDDLAKEWLQHLRDFDVRHPGCVFKVLAAAPKMSSEALYEVLEGIEPGFPVVRRWAKEEDDAQ